VEGDYFGELEVSKQDPYSATCIAENRVTLLTLDREYFFSMLGVAANLMMSSVQRRSSSKSTRLTLDSDLSCWTVDSTLGDIEMLATLGTGSFGRVRLCRRRGDETQLYAIKCQSKASIVSGNRQKDVLSELMITREIQHPSVVKLFAALQDSKYIYFVLELLPGGELYTHLKRVGAFSEHDATFYVASIVSALSAMHEKQIAYRDLKPVRLY
jgi:serine/threonine protein kinase